MVRLLAAVHLLWRVPCAPQTFTTPHHPWCVFWCGHRTCKFTMKSFPICSSPNAPICPFAKTRNAASLSKACRNGWSARPPKFMVCDGCGSGVPPGRSTTVEEACGGLSPFVSVVECWCGTRVSGLMQRGAAVRATGATRMNEMSSRSHALFIIIVEQTETAAPGSPSAPAST